MNKFPIGILQGRLTPSHGRGIQFFPDAAGEWEEEFEKARKAGLASIELLVRPTHLRDHPLMNTQGRARLRELSQSYDVVIPSVHGYYAAQDDYAHDLEAIVEATAQMQAKTVLVSFFHEKKLSPSQDETWKRAHELMTPPARQAKKYGVQLGIEAELPAQTILQFIAEAETPEVFGVYYDLGNQFACGFPVVEEIGLLGKNIAGVHLKDRLPNVTPGVESASVALGQGTADFKSALTALHDVGYAGHLILQGARGEDGAEVELNASYREYITGVMDSI